MKTSTRLCLSSIVLWVTFICVKHLWDTDGFFIIDYFIEYQIQKIIVGVIGIILLKFILGGLIDKKPDSKSE